MISKPLVDIIFLYPNDRISIKLPLRRTLVLKEQLWSISGLLHYNHLLAAHSSAAQVSDTTGDATSTAAGSKIKSRVMTNTALIIIQQL